MKTAVITGASSGIGLALSNHFVESHWRVYGVSRTDPEIHSENFEWVKIDFLDVDTIEGALRAISEPAIDLIINNAGVASSFPALDYSSDEFLKTFAVNFQAPILITNHFLKTSTVKTVVTIATELVFVPVPGFSLYAASKAAITNYMSVMASEIGETQFYTMMPGMVDTPLLRKLLGNSGFSNWGSVLTVDDMVLAVVESINSEELKSGSNIIVAKTGIGKSFMHSYRGSYVFNASENKLSKLVYD